MFAFAQTLIYNRNNKGPKADLCGTSVGINAHFEL